MRTIIIYDPELKPLAIMDLNPEVEQALHQYHCVNLPLPMEAPTLMSDKMTMPNTMVEDRVELRRSPTTNGWRTVTDASLESVLRLDGARPITTEV